MKTNYICFALLLHLAAAVDAFAQGTAFTYQGRLNDGASVASGNYDLRFALFDAPGGGDQQGNALTNAATAISNGLFTVTLDFGNQYPGAGRWLEIGVRSNGSGAFATLSPRQALTSTPYAVNAANAGTATVAATASSVAAANITGAIALAQLPPTVVTNGASGVTISGTFSGNGLGLTNADIVQLTSGALVWGNFALTASPVVGPLARSVTAADVNGDGKVDLVSAHSGTGTGGGAGLGSWLAVQTNNGSGGFVLSSSPPLSGFPVAPVSVVAADVNGDGKVDLISANSGSNTLSVLTNNGNGSVVLSSSPGVGLYPNSVVAADVNGDGQADLISANRNDGTLSVLTNNGSGGFVLSSSPVVGSGPVSVVAADVNGDGKVDLISADAGILGPGHWLSVLTNDGSGGFVLSSSPGVGLGSPLSVVAADVNGDGKVDLISANGNATRLAVLTNDGSGGFVLSSSPGVGGVAVSVAAADVNGDGKVDLISANLNANTLSVLSNNGSGGFVLSSSPGVGLQPNLVVAADVNGDGKVDLISWNVGAGTLSVLFNTPAFNGSFSGNGSGLTSLDASQLTSGAVPDARLSANVSLLGVSIESAEITDDTIVNADINTAAAIADTKLATISSANKVADSALSPNVALRSVVNTFTANQVITNAVLYSFGGIVVRPVVTNYSALAAYEDATGSAFRAFIGRDGVGLSGDQNLNHMYIGTYTVHPVKFYMGNVAQMIINTNGNVGIGTLDPTNKLHVAGGITCTALVQTSDRNAKENFAPVSTLEVLNKVTAMPITTWNFKDLKDGRHMGPMAQDFYAAFGLGGGDTTITSVDPDGVALAAIQGLNEKVEAGSQKSEVRSHKSEERIQKLESENAELRSRLQKLEQAVQNRRP